jgi:hypothetical protein
VFRFLAIAVVQAALLLAAFGLGRAMTTPPVSLPAPAQSSLEARPLNDAPRPGCGVTGDLVGDANPADVARSLCPAS